MLMSLGFLPGHRNVVFGDLKRSLCLETCVCDRLPPGVGKTAILSSLINSRDQMQCSIFSHNKMQIINEPARKSLALSSMAGQVQLGCQVELVVYSFCIRLHLRPFFACLQ